MTFVNGQSKPYSVLGSREIIKNTNGDNVGESPRKWGYNLLNGPYQADEFVNKTDKTSVSTTHRLYERQSLAE